MVVNSSASKGRTNLFQFFDFFEQSLLEANRSLPPLRTATLIGTPSEAAANTDAHAGDFFSRPIDEDTPARNRAASGTKPDNEALSEASRREFIKNDMRSYRCLTNFKVGAAQRDSKTILHKVRS